MVSVRRTAQDAPTGADSPYHMAAGHAREGRLGEPAFEAVGGGDQDAAVAEAEHRLAEGPFVQRQPLRQFGERADTARAGTVAR